MNNFYDDFFSGVGKISKILDKEKIEKIVDSLKILGPEMEDYFF